MTRFNDALRRNENKAAKTMRERSLGVDGAALFQVCLDEARSAADRGFQTRDIELANTQFVCRAVEKLEAEGFDVSRSYKGPGITIISLSWSDE